MSKVAQKTYREKNRALRAQKCREWRQKNPDRKLAYGRKWDADNRERKNANHRKWTAENPEKVRKYEKTKAERHWEKIKAYRAKWARDSYAKDPIKAAQRGRVRRAKKLASGGCHTHEQIKELWDQQGHKCAVPNCTQPISAIRGKNRFHIDHIEPLTKGGSDAIENIQILCGFHNREKGGNDPYDWAQKAIGRLFL